MITTIELLWLAIPLDCVILQIPLSLYAIPGSIIMSWVWTAGTFKIVPSGSETETVDKYHESLIISSHLISILHPPSYPLPLYLFLLLSTSLFLSQAAKSFRKTELTEVYKRSSYICDTDEGNNSYSDCFGDRYDQSDTAPSPCQSV